jgi:hypothetical protein
MTLIPAENSVNHRDGAAAEVTDGVVAAARRGEEARNQAVRPSAAGSSAARKERDGREYIVDLRSLPGEFSEGGLPDGDSFRRRQGEEAGTLPIAA